jgi:hypothetical protein
MELAESAANEQQQAESNATATKIGDRLIGAGLGRPRLSTPVGPANLLAQRRQQANAAE